MAEETKSKDPADVEAEPKPEAPGLETKIDMDELGPCKRLLKVAVPAEKVLEEIEKGYRDLGSNLVYPGFRKGHVPRVILEKRFGSQIHDEVKDGLLQSSFEDAVEEKSITPVGEPKFDKVEFEIEKPFSFEVTLNVRPEFELGTYKGIQVEEPSVEPTDEEVERAIGRLLQNRAELVTVEDGVAREGDYLIADLGFFVGEEQVHLEEEVSIPVGEDRVFGVKGPQVRDLFMGAKIGEPREAEVVLPDDFPEEAHRGKKARITLAPKEVKRPKVPELDEALAKDLGHDSVDAVREFVSFKIEEHKELGKNSRIESDILGKMLESMDLPLPEEVIEGEADNVDARQRWRMQQLGYGESEIEESLRESRASSMEEIGRSLKEIFVLDKIADAEKVFVTEDEVDRLLTARAAEHGKSLSAFKDELRTGGRLGGIRAEMRQAKVRAFLREHAEIAPAPPKKAPAKKASAKKGSPAKKRGGDKKAPPPKKGAAARKGATPKKGSGGRETGKGNRASPKKKKD